MVKKALILDISFWQDNPDTENVIVDFNKMASSDASGVIFRVGQATWEDIKFEEYWKNSHGKGLLRGGYWYYDNSVDPKIQARKCASILKKYDCKLELPLFADFEDRRIHLDHHGWEKWYQFMEELKLLSSYDLGVYTGYYYWEEHKPQGINSFKERYFSQYPLWLAQYPYPSHSDESLYIRPMIPKTWSNWDLWQVSDRGDGHFYGVESSRIDINYFNGTKHDLEKRYGKAESEKEEDPVSSVNKSIEVFGFFGTKKIMYENMQKEN